MGIPETLDEEAVVSSPSQAQNPFDKTQEEAFDLTSKNDGGFDSNSRGMGVSNVELLSRFIDNKKGIEVVDCNTEENKGKGLKNVDVSVPKEGSIVFENEDVVVEKSVVESSGNGISLFVEVFGPPDGLLELDKQVDLNHLYEENRALLSGNGENSSVEVSDLHCSILGVSQNGTIDWEAKAGNEAQEEFKLSMGDLVWVKTKTQSWWPGLIVDPLHAPKDAANSDQRASLLVKYFGNGSCVWCSPLQLKPFVQNFEQMSAQGNSMNFNGAVKKAANEFGSRVKSQMTCSCILREQNQATFDALSNGNGGSKDLEMLNNLCPVEEYSVNQFKPENFVAFVKFLALDISMPGMLEFEATRNRLYAFYRALGHRQLSMHQLRGTTDVKDSAAEDELKQSGDSSDRVLEKNMKDLGKVSGVEVDMGLEKCRRDFSEEGNENSEARNRSAEVAHIDNCQFASPGDGGNGGKSGKSYESRERRRSRYLSPPYTDLSFGGKNSPVSEENGTEGGKVDNIIDGQSVGSPSLVSSGKKLLKKKSMQAISGLSSSNMLSELRFAALDCLHSHRSKHFDQFERFFSGFRSSVFQDKSNGEIDRIILQTEPGVEVPTDKARGMVEESTESGVKKPFAGSTGSDTQVWSEAQPNVIPKRRRRKKEMVTIDPRTIPAPGFSEVNGNPTSGPFMINFQTIGCLTSEGMSVPKKGRKRAGINVELHQAKVAAVLPDLNGNCSTPSSLLEDSMTTNVISFMDGTASAKTEGITGLVDVNGNNAQVGSFLKDVQVMGPCSTQDIAEVHKEEGMKGASSSLNPSSKSEVTAKQMEPNGNNADQSSSFHKDLMDLLSPVGKPGPKKRKRKEKASVEPIPDLNGNAANPISPGANLPAGEGKAPRKRRKNKPIAGFVPQISINYNKVQTLGEASGFALLLRFAQGFPMPSKEALTATFCGFGRIKELETQALSDSISAQVVFENSSDAGYAFKSLEKSSPFGPALINYGLHHLPAASGVPVTSKTVEGFKMPARKPYGLKPITGETPDLSVIRKNLEMMTSMLEKAGDDLSPETRAKLETEVKGLLKKVSTMVGSSSS
ncbi:serine/threonine-protein kinase ATM isoform X2 [Rhododendron vialii]|uniref:serine/threonine-protein kinase ATM isoform X2 n=1 Tax=Rhododendron vialii TaxID=182163 RepID=UPI00265FB6B4|nr:serine/threonine-protein kinase ATM isoform X2 [Rhododendron vialii]